MSSHYRVQDLVDQNTESMVQRVVTEEGVEFSLTRLKLSPEALAGLFGEDVFEEALEKLRSLKHVDLREVIDGGMDELDGSPWVTSPWIEGKALTEQQLKEKDILSLEGKCQHLVRDLGELSQAVNFDPAHILSVRTPDGRLHVRFSIDYFCWFNDLAAGHAPGVGRSGADGVRKLLERLVIEQLRPPKKEMGKDPIPFVEERSPALTSYQAPRERWLMRALSWVGFLLAFSLIIWLTRQGMARMEENPRKEVPAWNAGGVR